jgi:hypothetical protein
MVLIGCTTGTDTATQPDAPPVPITPDAPPAIAPDAPPALANHCSPLFAQDILPEYHVDISADEWAKLDEEFLNTRARLAAGLDPTPYHPIGFHYEEGGHAGPQIAGVLLRLKGNSSWLETIDFDADPKMQFVIAFNQVDSDQRFMGVRKVDLDMPRSDWTFLQQRLALFYLRGAGIEAQCANSGRLVINGVYYGLYTNLERPDKEYLQRVFPGAANGDLWKGGRVLKTNEDSFSWDRLNAFWGARYDLPALEPLVDLPGAVREWASEAMVGDADGYYTGHPNFFLYDHPTRGFVWLPDDLDTAFDADFLAADATPKFPMQIGITADDRAHYLTVMNDETWFERYVLALTEARSHYDAAALRALVDQWAPQIEASAAEDTRKPFTMAQHAQALVLMKDYTAHRAAYIDSWLDCWSHGGVDVDGDGFDFCNDCDDADATVHPGAAEVCNGVDDNCNGRVDDVAGQEVCP